MRPLLILVFTLFYFSIFKSVSAQSSETVLLRRLDSINNRISQAFNKGSVSGILPWYASNAICMPEFHTAITGTGSIRDYYHQWFEKSSNSDFQKQVFSAERMGDYILETGHFTSRFSITDTGSRNYDGKYLRCWSVRENNPSKIVMEIWGSKDYIDRSVLPPVQISQQLPKAMHAKQNPSLDIVKKRNSLIARLVSERNGAEHAKLFTPDAIYMPYYLPMLIGKEAITAYFIEHEKPGEVIIDSISIQTGSVLKAGSHIIEYGFYKVKWRAGNDAGTVMGKSINIWRKERSGEYLMYRQMVNHD